MSKSSFTRDEAIRRLQTVESEIRRLGVRRPALFGSVLRNEAHPDSDVDVLVEFAPTEKTFDRFTALADLLEDMLEHRVERGFGCLRRRLNGVQLTVHPIG